MAPSPRKRAAFYTSGRAERQVQGVLVTNDTAVQLRPVAQTEARQIHQIADRPVDRVILQLTTFESFFLNQLVVVSTARARATRALAAGGGYRAISDLRISPVRPLAAAH
jgi:ATP phosphoribosyltransferase regulatory subunit HisZ